MDNAGYVSLTRQSGLLKEMQTIANNIANLSTTGYRREGVVFSEYVQQTDRGEASVSYANANGRLTDKSQGGLTQTGGEFDFAIEGDGFFVLQTPGGERLTRAGSFTPNAESELVSAKGYHLLDTGGAPIFVPPGAASISLAPDGTISADGVPLAQVGIVVPSDGNALVRDTGTMFVNESENQPAESAVVFQRFLEDSNVSPVVEMARMIEVQRSYELGQKFLDREDDRIRSAVRLLGQ